MFVFLTRQNSMGIASLFLRWQNFEPLVHWTNKIVTQIVYWFNRSSFLQLMSTFINRYKRLQYLIEVILGFFLFHCYKELTSAVLFAKLPNGTSIGRAKERLEPFPHFPQQKLWVLFLQLHPLLIVTPRYNNNGNYESYFDYNFPRNCLIILAYSCLGFFWWRIISEPVGVTTRWG